MVRRISSINHPSIHLSEASEPAQIRPPDNKRWVAVKAAWNKKERNDWNPKKRLTILTSKAWKKCTSQYLVCQMVSKVNICQVESITSWWFQPNPFEKYAQVKLDPFPKVRDEKKNCLKPPPSWVTPSKKKRKRSFEKSQIKRLFQWELKGGNYQQFSWSFWGVIVFSVSGKKSNDRSDFLRWKNPWVWEGFGELGSFCWVTLHETNSQSRAPESRPKRPKRKGK